MRRNIFLLIIYTFIFPFYTSAQTDDYTGTWQMNIPSAATGQDVFLELQIASPEKNILYPAQLKIQRH